MRGTWTGSPARKAKKKRMKSSQRPTRGVDVDGAVAAEAEAAVNAGNRLESYINMQIVRVFR